MDSVVVIDSDEKILLLIERALKDLFEVYKLSSSLEGLDVVRTIFPSLILLDIKMPDMDGYELCSKLKGHESTKDIPVIFMSDRPSGPSRSLAYRLGAINYLKKPLDLEELRPLLQAILAQTKAPLMGNVLEFEDFFLDVKNYYCGDDHGEYRLTHSECLLLETLMRAQSETVRREVLANKLNGYSEHFSFRTVDSHISSIRKKIKNTALQIASIYSVGYRLQRAKKL